MLRQLCLAGGSLALCGTTLALYAQPPRGGNPGGGVDAAIGRLMDYDADKDGKLTKEELGDDRLTALFQRADANGDGALTREELASQFTKDAAVLGANRGPGGPPPGGPGSGGPPPGGFGPPAPGQVLPPFVQDQLHLSEKQRQELAELQKDVDGKLGQILTREQMQQLQDMANRGPRGPGGPGNRPPRPAQ